MWIYLNDRFVPKDEAVVSVFDHGYLYGDGVFETLRAYRGKIFLLTDHLERLERSAAALKLALPLRRERLADLAREAITRNHLQDAYLRVTVSRGPGDIGLDPALCKSPTLVIIAKPFHPYPPAFYTHGVSVIIAKTRRNMPEAIPPQAKSLNYLNNLLAHMEAKAAGAQEAVLLNHDGNVTEGTTSNVFVVRKGRLRTPTLDCGILAGLTRGVVISIARDQGIAVEEARLTVDELYAAEECFLTNTTQEVMPVTHLDGKTIGRGRPGEVTRRLHASFQAGLDRLLDVG